MIDLRPVSIANSNLPRRKGLFHGWGGTSEFAYAIVEYEDGSVESVHMNDVHFLDKLMKTNQFAYAWEGGAND